MIYLFILLIDPILESILVFNLGLHDCVEICFIGLFGWLEVLLIHHFAWTTRSCCFCSDDCDRLILNCLFDFWKKWILYCYYDENWMVKVHLSNLQCESSMLRFDCCDFWPEVIRGWLQNGFCGQIVNTRTSQPFDFYQQFMKYTFIYLISFKFGPTDFNQTAFTSSVCTDCVTVGFSDVRESRSVDKCSWLLKLH